MRARARALSFSPSLSLSLSLSLSRRRPPSLLRGPKYETDATAIEEQGVTAKLLVEMKEAGELDDLYEEVRGRRKCPSVSIVCRPVDASPRASLAVGRNASIGA